MKRATCVAVLLLASGAWGQQRVQVTDGSNEICGLDAKGQPFLGSGYTWRQCAILLMSIELPLAKQEKKAPPRDWIFGPYPPPSPFDVPPKEMDSMISGQKIRNYFCTDKQRVLLMSEDGKWHCFAFFALAGAR